jgi:hypothetical protein
MRAHEHALEFVSKVRTDACLPEGWVRGVKTVRAARGQSGSVNPDRLGSSGGVRSKQPMVLMTRQRQCQLASENLLLLVAS